MGGVWDESAGSGSGCRCGKETTQQAQTNTLLVVQTAGAKGQQSVANGVFWQLIKSAVAPLPASLPGPMQQPQLDQVEALFLLLVDPSVLDPSANDVTVRLGGAALRGEEAFVVQDRLASNPSHFVLGTLREAGDAVSVQVPPGSFRSLLLTPLATA